MESNQPGTLALVGPGRAGPTVAFALIDAGWSVAAVAGRDPSDDAVIDTAFLLGAEPRAVSDVGVGADLVIIATPDAAVSDAARAAAVGADSGALMVHLAGSLGLAAFHAARRFRSDLRFGALHPLVSIPSVSAGLDRLAGAYAAVAGDVQVDALASSMALHPFTVADADRPTYHAAAAVAANHLVALLAQVERLARDAGVPFEAFLPLVDSAVRNVSVLGPKAALSGPAARGDVETILAHLHALPEQERPSYLALAREAWKLADRTDALLDVVLFSLDEHASRSESPAVERDRSEGAGEDHATEGAESAL